MAHIHPTAIVESGAQLGENVTIGPYAVVNAQVRIGEGTSIGAHAVIDGRTTIGRDNRIFAFAAIGGMPQDKKYVGEPTELVIGDGNTIREYCTLNTGTVQDGGVTRIGDDNWIMAYVHIAHDCQIGNQTTMANNATLAGHVHVGDWVTVGGLTGIHQFVKIGAHAMLGFASADVRAAQAEQTEHDRLAAERERLGPVNLIAAQELAELEQQQETSRAESAELTQAIHQLRGSIGHLNREGRQRLLAAFEAVDEHFRRLFTALFNGGQARLELIESDDPLEAGLEILAQPPGKKLATLTLLSGGEQALTAIALIFALFLTNPAPICVLDEVDAPLDDANVERFCDLLDHMVQDTKTRYLIVTHNAVTMARMHRLFGVTMIEKGVSRLVSVDLGGAEELLAAE